MTMVVDAPTRPARPAVRSSTPRRLRRWMLIGMVTALAVLAATSLAMSRLQSQVRTIGDDAAPQAATASDLYFALSDLDAQVARLVLIGTAEAQAGNQIDALTTYGQRSRQIDADLEQALTTATTGEDREIIQELLNGLAVYRQWTWQALTVVDQQPADAAGPPPAGALGYYSQATNVVHLELLPAAKRLRDASQARLDHAYADQRTTERWGITVVVVLGGALAILLLVLQGWLVRRFRRRVNPALLVGTLLTLGLVASATTVFAVEGRWLAAAQRDSFAPYLALSQAQAISYDAAADTSRYLLSGRLPSYKQDFTTKSDCLIKGGACGPGGDRLDGGLGVLAGGHDIGPAYTKAVVDRWMGYQRDHDRIVALADSGQTAAAVNALTGIKRGEAAFDFYYYDTAISQITVDRKDAFDAAFRDARNLLTGWPLVPVVVMAIVLLLVPAGLWPRLSEYR